MYDQLFSCSRTVERYRNGPLLEERLGYLAHCAAQGSTRSSLRHIAQHQLVLVEYLHLETADSITIQQIQAAANLWVARQPQPHTHNATDNRYGRSRFISDARQWLTFLGRLRPQETRGPYTHLIEAFADHMLREKGLSPYTIRIRCWYVEQFLNRYWEQGRSFDMVTIADIDAAIARKGAQDSYGRQSLQHYANALRAFFRYAEQRDWCSSGLTGAIMAPRLYADT